MNKKRKSTLIFNILVVFLLIFVVTMTVKSVVCKARGKVNYIFGKYAIMYVVSESMEPEIPKNSYIIIKKTDTSKIEKNTIISFVSDDPEILGSINTHRVIEVRENEFVTKGDNVATADPVTAKRDKVVGTFAMNAKFLTAVGRLFMSKLGAFIIFTFLVLTIILAIVRVVITACMSEVSRKVEAETENNQVEISDDVDVVIEPPEEKIEEEMKQDVSEDEQNH